MSDAAGQMRLAINGALATLTIDRPAKLNALTPAMLAELEQHLAAIDRNSDVRVVLLTGAGERAFCVGADVTVWSALDPLDMWRWWVRDGQRTMERLARLRQPTIAAINGFAFGGGLELALAADLRVASKQATFAMPETKIGTLPGWHGTQRLPEIVGVARAKQLILSGARIDAATAERWSLVNEVVPAEHLLARAQELAGEIASNSPNAVQLAKASLNNDPAGLEGFAGALAAMTEDGREGIAAFREKRAPRFTGQ